MIKMNKLIIVAVLAMAIVAIAGVADAKVADVTIDVNTIQTNGNYVGVPTILGNNPGQYGYNYTFNPDGTYTVFGTLTNYENASDITVWVSAESSTDTQKINVDVPAAVDHYYVTNVIGDKQTLAYSYTAPSTVSFSITLKADSADDIAVYFSQMTGAVDLSDTDYVNAPEGLHTVNQGPMSNMVVIFTNGKINTNSTIMYQVNQTSTDLGMLYSNGKFDFKNSPLYSFVG